MNPAGAWSVCRTPPPKAATRAADHMETIAQHSTRKNANSTVFLNVLAKRDVQRFVFTELPTRWLQITSRCEICCLSGLAFFFCCWQRQQQHHQQRQPEQPDDNNNNQQPTTTTTATNNQQPQPEQQQPTTNATTTNNQKPTTTTTTTTTNSQ